MPLLKRGAPAKTAAAPTRTAWPLRAVIRHGSLFQCVLAHLQAKGGRDRRDLGKFACFFAVSRAHRCVWEGEATDFR